METTCPKKYILKITTDTGESINSFLLNLKLLQQKLSELIELPGGNIVEITQLESVTVLLWNFDVFTSCSGVSRDQFSDVKVCERKLDLPQKGVTSNVGWSFFTLKHKMDVNNFTNEDKQILKQSYVFPTPASEMVRINVLLNSLRLALGDEYRVDIFDGTKKTHHYCQFSGGGGLYITKLVEPQPLVFLGSTTDDDDDDEDAYTLTTSTSSPPTGNSPSRPPDNVSPVSHGTSKLASLSVEGKKDNFDIETLKYQLWANMVIATVERFMMAISMFTKQNILVVKKLIGYGIACTGSGIVGIYKLEMEFNDCTQFVTKVEIGNRDRLPAAVIIDCGLDYYVNSTKFL